jgi:hypothetical protein
MLRRPAGKNLGLWSFQSLSCRRPFLAYPCVILPRYQSNWNSDKREAYDGHNSETREQRQRRQNDGAKVTLDVDTLGKPGQIVVVSARRRRMLNRSRNRNEKEPGETISTMLDDLDDEKSTPSDKSIQERIDASRGTYQIKETLPATDFKTLCSQLASSFTYKQLSDYILEHNRRLGELKGKQWTWDPRSKAKGSGKEKTKAFKGKARLADTIARDCWQLVVDGELGQLDFYLSARSISLLVHAEHFSFHELASLHGCSIDVTQSAGLLSLTGKRNDCESVHEIILDATARTRELDVGISAHIHGDGNQIFTSDFLEWVNTTYGVFVEQRSYSPPEKILYLAENKSGAEDARRTLNLALTNTTSPSTPFSTYLPASELASAYSYRPEVHASWFERQKIWFRWAMSSSQNAEAETLETPFFDKHQTRLSDELLKLLRNTTPNSVGLHESVTATVGKCLFMQKPSFTDTSISPTQLGRMSLPRIFANDGPLVTQLMNALGPDHPKKEQELYRLRLTPTSSARASPDLEIEVAMDSQIKGEINVQSVKAIWSTNSVDYLLPENGLDLRFTRIISQDLLDRPSLDSRLTQDFSPESAPLSDNQKLLKSIKQSLQGPFAATGAFSGPVPPPAFCNISLPQYIIQESASKAQLKAPSEGNVTVEYMFPPLSDIRGAIVQKYDFGGRPLDYRYYESGPFLAARTNEVSLGMAIPPIDPAEEEKPKELLDHEFHSFYNAACDMAFKIHRNRYAE